MEDRIGSVDLGHKLHERGHKFCINDWYILWVQKPNEIYCLHWDDVSEHLKLVKDWLIDDGVVEIVHNLQESGQ